MQQTRGATWWSGAVIGTRLATGCVGRRVAVNAFELRRVAPRSLVTELAAGRCVGVTLMGASGAASLLDAGVVAVAP